MNLNDVTLSTKDSGCINYVKARMAIEEQMPNRQLKREAKMAVISHLNGSIKHPSAQEIKRGAHKLVIFPDNTKARF